jgi:hypothetical protein
VQDFQLYNIDFLFGAAILLVGSVSLIKAMRANSRREMALKSGASPGDRPERPCRSCRRLRSFKNNIKRSQPAAAPAGQAISAGSPMFIFFQPCNSTCAFGSWPFSR